MSNPQGSGLVNLEYFTQLTDQVNAIAAQVNGVRSKAALQAELQAMIDQTIPGLQDQQAAITDSLGQLAPAVGLLTMNPANLSQVITFCSSLITNYLSVQLAPYQAYIAQASALASSITSLISTIQNIADELGVTVTFPATTSTAVGQAAGVANVNGVH